MTRRWGVAAWLAAVVAFAILVVWHWEYAPLLESGDYAHYLLHARALVEGRGYTDTGYLYSPAAPFLGPRAYPPGLPLTIAPLLALFGAKVVVWRLLMVASALGFIVLAGRYFARQHVLLGTAVALVLGVSLELSYATNAVMSDLGFGALIWGTVLAADRAGPWTLRRITLVTLLGLAAMAYRIAGIALIPAFLLFTAMRFREHRLRPATPVALWLAVLGLALVVLPVTEGVSGQIPLTFETLGHGFSRAVTTYRLAVFQSVLYPFPWNHANDGYHIVAGVLLVVGLLEWLRRCWRSFLVAFSVPYLLMLGVLAVADGRYLWPLFPMAIFGLINGVRTVAAQARRGWSSEHATRVAYGTAALISIAAMTTHAFSPRPATLLGQPDVRELFKWLEGRKAHEPIRVAFINPRVLTWETGIPAMATIAWPEGVMVSEMRRLGVTHLVEGDLGLRPRLNGLIAAFVAARPSLFTRVYANSSFQVYRIKDMRPPEVRPLQ